MTDKEMIQALKYCGDPDEATCYGCPARKMCRQNPGLPIDRMAADRLEALLADNAMLKREIKVLEDANDLLIAENDHFREVTKMVPKWRPASEPPEEDGRYLCSVMSLVSKGRNYADILKWDKDGFRDGYIYTDLVTHWMPLPSTEGVE